ncbi:MAG: MmgE/PrpD family protein [Rhodobacteraceae bacterium]|nr:MmgE/PrpD family protein [Paracoccaceae bacterium]
MTAPLTRAAGDFAAGIATAAIPAAALSTARLGFTDAIACLLAGRDEPVSVILRDYVAGRSDGKGSVCLLGRGRAAPELAALIDATAAHALDYDDYMFSNHPSAVLVAAILACAQVSGADGARMARAYLAGYEIWGDLMLREADHFHSKGWHPTAVLGPVGAAAAAAHVLGLDGAGAGHAIALSASHSGGVMGNFGSMAKPYHAGRAAEAGVRAALLARAGFTARGDVLEGPAGLLAALSPRGNVDLKTPPQFGRRWRSAEAGLNIKKYPTVGASQRIIDAALALMAQTPLDTADIAGMEIRISRKFAAVMPFGDPAIPAEAKFSAQFAVAAALRFGKVGMAEVSQAALGDGELRRLIGAAAIERGEIYDPGYPNAAPEDWIVLTMRDGSRIESPRIRRASGHADAPLSPDELWRKFAGCAEWSGLAEHRARILFERLQSIDTLPDAGSLFQDE